MRVEFIHEGGQTDFLDQPAVPRIGDEVYINMKIYQVTEVYWIYNTWWDGEPVPRTQAPRIVVWLADRRAEPRKRIFRSRGWPTAGRSAAPGA